MIEVLRREEKYLINLCDAHIWQHQLSKVLMTDRFSQNGRYMVRSLYFDTPDDKDYHDKMTEQNLRRKIRMRIYHPQDTMVKLELKQKENIFQKKRSLLITKEDAQELMDGRYSALLRYKEDLAAELYAIMSLEVYKPKSIVEYKRYAFITKENNTRLTFDSDIRVTESSFDLFSENLPLTWAQAPDKVILEVKYDRFLLSYITDLISTVNERSISSSKYCLSRMLGYPN